MFSTYELKSIGKKSFYDNLGNAILVTFITSILMWIVSAADRHSYYYNIRDILSNNGVSTYAPDTYKMHSKNSLKIVRLFIFVI
ncbi:hypothetical protein IAI10_12940 [Clostridium sp. 19966]|uniref:hypothetical protein n=1 Tax=Clostridium sp. 19966 TaxID=2768166 RepID=UPI0028DEC19F|nr:hypothetical protein [Clostridium sp. 19966]MDT8717571.1 hypothetical protein [Clostridium sp. 19966]